jgi:putative phosphoribosyl transferase
MSEIVIQIGPNRLFGELTVPKGPTGLILFAHGSGSGRHSPRNQFVATKFQSLGLATLLFDLLTLEEEAIDEQTTEWRFNIPFLAKRLIAVTDWVKETHKLPIGYFGSSTGAAAALMAAAERKVEAVVSRGGRPDLAKEALSKVSAPTLLIVGGLDTGVIELNQGALALLKCTKQLEIVPGATHLFEESGKLEVVSKLAGNWFLKYLSR